MTDDAPIDYSAISSEQATTLLDRMTADHRAANPDPLKLTPAEASAKLTESAKAVPQASDGGLSPYKTLSFAAALDEAGIPPEGIRTVLEDKKFTAADVHWARGLKARMTSDPEFIKALLGGSQTARHEFTATMAILSSKAAEEAK
jgi:hypothetical protein